LKEELESVEGKHDEEKLACPGFAPHSLGRRPASEEISELADGPTENPDEIQHLQEHQTHQKK